MDVKSYEDREEALALLKVLTMGNHEIDQGKFRDAEEVFTELDGDDVCVIGFFPSLTKHHLK